MLDVGCLQLDAGRTNRHKAYGARLKVMAWIEGGRLKVEGFRNSKIEFRILGGQVSQ
jgi:hypothetical protein